MLVGKGVVNLLLKKNVNSAAVPSPGNVASQERP